MTPEGLYGRRKWVALLRRQEGLAGTSRGAVDRAMRSLGLEGVRRAKKLRTTVPDPDGKRADDLLNRDFTAPAPNRVWVTDFTYVRTWAGFVYVAFVVDVFAQRIVGWRTSAPSRRPKSTATTSRVRSIADSAARGSSSPTRRTGTATSTATSSAPAGTPSAPTVPAGRS